MEVPNIPTTLNEPLKMSKWTVEEIACFFISFVVSWLFVGLFWALPISFVTYFLLKAFRKSPAGDLIRKWPYWFLGSKVYKSFPDSKIREFFR